MEPRTLLSPIEQHGLLSEIARLLLTVVPADFRTAELDGFVLAGASGYRLRVDAGDPEQMRRVTVPHGLDEIMRELRAGMYDPRRGSWYSLIFELSGTGTFSVAYNYDRRPSSSILDEEFSRDLSNFPRAEEYIPDWLDEVMSSAANTFGSVLDSPWLPDPHSIADAFRTAGWNVEPNAGSEYTFTTGWARLTTMNCYPIVRFAGRTDLSRSAELEAVLATLAWHAEFETYDDRARLLGTIRTTPPKGTPMPDTHWPILDQAHEALRNAVRGTSDWAAPTPCDKWNATQVLQHAVGDQIAYAAFLTGGDGPADDPFAPSGKLDAAPEALLEQALTRTAAAWAEVAPDAGDVAVPVPPNSLPAPVGVGACALDAAVHAWDLAMASGRPSPLTPAMASELLPVAQQIVEPLRAYGAFAAALEPQPDDDDADALLRYLGRRPDWK